MQTRMKIGTSAMSYSDGCKQGNAKLLSIAREKKWNSYGSMCPGFHLNPFAPARKEKLQTILWNFGIRDKDRVSRNSAWYYNKSDSWTNPSALFPLWFECHYPWWDLFMLIHLSSN